MNRSPVPDHLGSLLASATQPAFVVAVSGEAGCRLSAANPAFVAATDLAGRLFAPWPGANDAGAVPTPACAAAVARCIETRLPFGFDCAPPGGSPAWRVSLAPLFDAGFAVRRCLGTAVQEPIAAPLPDNDLGLLFRSGETLAQAVHATGAGMIVADATLPDLPLVFANRAFSEISGYRAEDVIGRNCRFLQGSDTDPATVAQIRLALQAGRDIAVEILNYRKNGRPFWNSLTINPIAGEDGRPRWFVGTSLDITEQKRLAAALAASEERVRVILATAANAIITADRYGKIREFNKAAEELFGYRADDIVGAGLEVLMPAALRPFHQGFIDKYLATGVRHIIGSTRELRGVRRDGSEIDVELGVNEVILGTETLFVGVLRDITQRRQAEAELERERRLLGDAIESISEGFALYDAEDRLVLCNQKYKDLYAESADLMTPGKRFEEIIREGARRGQYAEAIGRIEDWVAERMHRRRSPEAAFEQPLGDGRWLRISDRPTRDGGLVGIRTEVTEQKRTLAALSQAKAEAEEAVKAKSNFLAAMSHEIRTPMNGVIGMTELLLDTALTSDQEQFARAISNSATALLTIINDILDVSKLEAGRVTLESVPFSLGDVIEGVVELLTPRARDKGIEIGFFIAPGLQRPLIGDPTRLRQILVNLVGNAVKFTEHGHVGIEAAAEEIGPGLLILRLEVSDTGIGIPRHALPNLFGKFFQVDGSITRRYGGTGLGLAICHDLAELMGGGIAVDSEVGCGSRFQINLPMKMAGDLPARVPPSRLLHHRRALVVDDLELNRRIQSLHLESLGLSVVTASDAVEALARLGETQTGSAPFDIVLIDQMMPNLSGSDLASLIRARPQLAELKLVLVSSIGQSGRPEPGEPSPFSAVLSKPLRQATLVDCLIRLFQEPTDPPRLVAPPSRPAPAPLPPRRPGQPRILLAEDNKTNQLFAATLLRRAGYEVEVVDDGLAAVAAVERGNFGLVLMDVQMPNLDGLDATARIRALRSPKSTVPIIAMTAHAFSDARAECLDHGMDDYISKPVNKSNLLAAVDRWLNAKATGAALN
ncbi:MAG: PAS domain S-box protein [Azospirillum sp.]|nr:PAS domain S-box protein [Azospirillum sp.]